VTPRHAGSSPTAIRRRFVRGFFAGLRVISPVLSGLLVIMAVLGLVIGAIEGWSIQESLYFAFVSGLTIGYGDLVPKTLLTRTLSIAIGLCGILLTAVVAALAVKALSAATGADE
jgi:hypothetical protein